MAWIQKFPVESDSKPGTFYTVGIKEDRSWGCSCPAWIFPRGGRGRQDCKHITQVKGMTPAERQELCDMLSGRQQQQFTDRARKAVATRRARQAMKRGQGIARVGRAMADLQYQREKESAARKLDQMSQKAVADLKRQIGKPEKKKEVEHDPNFRLIDLPD